MKASPTERIAGIAFFAFTLIQVPFFIVNTQLTDLGFVLLSPVQVTGANLVRNFPALAEPVDMLLLPGGWMRECLSPFLRCQFQTGGKGPCGTYAARLTDINYIKKVNNLPMLVKLLDNGIQQQAPIVYGCTMIVVSALFSLYYTVKTAVAGFLMLAWGVLQGNHTPLPPAVLVAFLVVYAGFNLEGVRGDLRQRQQRRAAAAAAPGATSSSTSSGRQSPGGGSKGQAAAGVSAKKAKQRKQA